MSIGVRGSWIRISIRIQGIFYGFLMKFLDGWGRGRGLKNSRLDFGGDLDHNQDPRFLHGIFLKNRFYYRESL